MHLENKKLSFYEAILLASLFLTVAASGIAEWQWLFGNNKLYKVVGIFVLVSDLASVWLWISAKPSTAAKANMFTALLSAGAAFGLVATSAKSIITIGFAFFAPLTTPIIVHASIIGFGLILSQNQIQRFKAPLWILSASFVYVVCCFFVTTINHALFSLEVTSLLEWSLPINGFVGGILAVGIFALISRPLIMNSRDGDLFRFLDQNLPKFMKVSFASTSACATGALESSATVFLSYSRKDSDTIRSIHKFLSTLRLKVLWDQHIHGGQVFGSKINDYICKSDAFLLFISTNSMNIDSYVHRELAIARDMIDSGLKPKHFVIPIKIQNCVIPDLQVSGDVRLTDIHILDCTEPAKQPSILTEMAEQIHKNVKAQS